MGTTDPVPDGMRGAVRRVFSESSVPSTPMTAAEVAENVDCTDAVARRTLDALAEDGVLEAKALDGESRVWWQDAASGRTDRRDSEALTAFVSAVQDYAIFTLDPDGVVVSWNEGAERIKGYTEEEIVGEHFSTFYTEGARDAGVPAENLTAARTNGRVEDEGQRVRADGSTFWANVTITAIRDDDGELRGFTKVTRDMTERREYEERLRRERDLTEQIVDTVPMSVCLLSEDGELVRANQRMLDRLDVSADELSAYSIDDWELYDSDGELIPIEEWPWSRVVESGEPVYDFQCQVDLPGVGRRWLSIDAALFDDEADDQNRVVAAVDDITDSEKRKRELRREYDQTTKLLQTAPIAVAVEDANGEAVLANDRARDYLGLGENERVDEATSTDDLALYDADGNPIDKSETPAAKVRAHGEAVFDEELRIERPDSDRRWFRINAAPVYGEDGELERVISAGEDITEQKEREQRLERQKNELETELREVFGRVSDAFFGLDEEFRFTHLNERAHELINPTDEDLIGRDIWEAFPEATTRRFKSKYERAMAEQETVSFEEYYPAPLDTWFEVRAYPSETGLSVYFRDISERKERERELEASEQRYRTLAENFPNGLVTMFDEDLEYTLAAGGVLDDLHVEAADIEGAHPEDVWHDDGATRLVSLLEATIEGERQTEELAYVGREWKLQAVPLTDEDGVVFGGMTVAQDITDRKERERELAKYKTIVETVSDAMYVTDEDGHYTTVNDAFTELTGYDRADVLGSHASNVVDEEILEQASEVRAALANEDVSAPTMEATITTADGERVPTEVALATLPIEGAERRVGVVRDISQRVERRRQIEESERRYRTLVENFPDGAVAMFNEDLEYTAVGGELVDATGVDPADRVGESVVDIYPEDIVAEVKPHFEAALEGEARSFEVEYTGRHLYDQTLPVETADGEVLGGMVVVQDVTERREAERELRESEERFRLLAENLEETVWMTTPDTTEMLYINPAYEDIWGREREAIYENSHVFLDGVHHEDRERVRDAYMRLPEESYDEVFRVVQPDGEVRWVHARGAPVTDDDGAVTKIVGIAEDITDRKEREHALERRTRQQAVVAELGQLALETDDLDQLMADAVREVADVLDTDYCTVLDLDASRQELQVRHGVGWDDAVIGSASVDAGEGTQSGYALASEEPVVVDDFGTETRFDAAELLTSHDIESGVSTVIGSVDNPWGILGTHDTDRTSFSVEDVNFVQSVANILTDAIERNRYNEELERLVADLEESNERLEQFAYAASHDLQEPLRMVSSYLSLIERRYEDALDEDGEEFLAYAVDGADRMREMIDALLKYSRVETRGDPFERVDLDDVLTGVHADLQMKIEETDADVTVEELPEVSGDPDQLRQVFQNLLDNALTYSGEEPPEVHVSAERVGDEWQIAVADDGIGIDPEQEDRVFEVFQRLHTQSEYSGTGIGLALCRRIVERHDGRLWVDSEPGEGATFTVALPTVGNDR